MKITVELYVSILCFLCTVVLYGDKTEYTFENVRATYDGEGTMVGSRVADYVYRIDITGNNSSTVFPDEVSHTLTIKPINNKEGEVIIDTIYCDGPLKKMKIALPPGRHRASCVRNIYVDGFVKKLQVQGADIGDSFAHDGRVHITGFVDTFMVKGQKFRPSNSDEIQWWGGNIWADITVNDYISKLMLKGGNLHYDAEGGVLGKVSFKGEMKKLDVKGQKVKTDKTDSSSKVVFGGGINSRINSNDQVIKRIQASGGALYASSIYCAELQKLDIKCPNPGQPEPFIPADHRGIIRSFVQTADPVRDFSECNLKQIKVKNANIRDSIFSVKGTTQGIKVKGDPVFNHGLVSNVILRAGYEGTLADTKRPLISPTTGSDTAIANGEAVVPFRVNSIEADEELTVWIQYRGSALNSYISNYVGETYSGTNRWKVTNYPASGMFVWAATGIDAGTYTDIVVRVRDDGIPNLTTDMHVNVTIYSSNVAPTVSYTPTNNPRQYVSGSSEPLSWIVTGDDPDLTDTLNLSFENDTLGLNWYRTNTLRQFYVYAPNPPQGTHTNIGFTITDAEGFSDTAYVDVDVISNVPLVTVETSLPSNEFSFLALQELTFWIRAEADTVSDITFIRPANLPGDATYFRMPYTRVSIASNKFSWSPDSADAGEYTWTFPVSATTESGGSTSSVSVTVTIVRPEPLVETSLAGNSFAGTAGSPLEFSIIATDNEANDLTFFRPDSLPYSVDYPPTVYPDVAVATNILSWTPVTSETGTYTWTFEVMDSTSLTGTITVIGTISPSAFAAENYAFSAPWADWRSITADAASYPGDIKTIKIDGNVYDSMFIAGVRDEPPEDWATALYRGKIGSAKIGGTAVSNTFVSGKKISLPGTVPPSFFDVNGVWINGTHATDENQE